MAGNRVRIVQANIDEAYRARPLAVTGRSIPLD
jgi:hypothetical protein